MANIHNKSSVDFLRPRKIAPVEKNDDKKKPAEREKVDYIFKDVIRAYPEDYAKIIKTREEWASQFE